ncbi:MAG TPA: chromate transporter [Candidatus Limnocylindria bacterium]|nr:chromate transporter [Candidatus Limnocylindria bacterium]
MRSPPSSRALARAWFDIGTQSVGGGTSTLFMIRRIVVERMRWITLRQFTEAWALSQLSPGIHLVALAGLLGRQMAGLRGVIVSVGAMMVPAAVITAVATAFLGEIAQHPLTIAALAGIGPVAGGMTIGLALTMAQPVLQRGRYAILDVAVIAAAFGILLGELAQTIVVIFAAGVFGAVFLRRERPTSIDTPMS